MELDYQLGEDIKEKLIPRAIDWFTGEALAFEELEDVDDDGFEDEDDDDDDDLSEDRDDEEEESDDDVGQPYLCPRVCLLCCTDLISRTTPQSPSRRLPSANRAKRLCDVSAPMQY